MSKTVTFCDPRQTKTVTLPSYPNSLVTIYDQLLGGDAWELVTKQPEDRLYFRLVRLIKEWNFVDEKGEKMEISIENLKKFPDSDLLCIHEAAADVVGQKKEEADKKKD